MNLKFRFVLESEVIRSCIQLLQISFLVFFVSLSAYSQVFVTSGGRQISGSTNIYKGNSEAMYINTAGLGVLDTNRMKIGFLQPGYNSHSESMSRGIVNRLTFSNKEFGEVEKLDFLDLLSDQPFNFNTVFEINWLTFYAGSPMMGGISAGLRDEIKAVSELDASTVSFLLLGRNVLDFAGGFFNTPIPGSWDSGFINFRHYRHIDLGYGRALIRDENSGFYIGAGVSKVFGIGYLDHEIELNNSIGNAAFSDFYTIKFADFETGGKWSSKLTSSIGGGMTYSGGVLLDFYQNKGVFTLGASLLNYGSVKWNKNIIRSETQSLNLEGNQYNVGLESYDFEGQVDYLLEAFNYQKDEEAVIVENLPGQVRVNGIYSFNNNFMLNLDLLSDLGSTVFRDKQTTVVAGMGWTPVRGLLPVRFSGGLLYHTEYKMRVPFGVSLSLGGMFTGFSISTNDLITLFNSKDNPLTSLSISFLGIGI